MNERNVHDLLLNNGEICANIVLPCIAAISPVYSIILTLYCQVSPVYLGWQALVGRKVQEDELDRLVSLQASNNMTKLDRGLAATNAL